MRSSKTAGMVAVVVATALWGVGGTVASSLFRDGVQPLELVAARTLITVAGLMVIMAVRRVQRPEPAVRIRPPLVIAFGLAVGLANAFLFLAIKHVPVAVAMVLQNLAPAFVLGYLVLRGRVRAGVKVAAGIIAALTGVVLVVQIPTTPLSGLDGLGIAFGIATAAAVAAFSLLGSQATRLYGALRANTYAFGVSSCAWLLFFVPRGTPDLVHHGSQAAGILFVGVFGTLAPFVLFSWGTARVGPQAGAINISLEPVFSAALAWGWLGQALSTLQIFGGALVIAAVVFLQRSPTGKPAPATPDLELAETVS